MVHYTSRFRALTMVELIVVIGLIGVLIAVLLAALAESRRRAATVSCQARLAEIGRAFGVYDVTYRGYWPLVHHAYSPSGTPDQPPYRTLLRRWPDFLSDALGGSPLNSDGTRPDAVYSPDGRHVFPGCPSFASEDSIGYAMNPYPAATPGGPVVPVTPSGAQWASRHEFASAAVAGRFFRVAEWQRANRRALVYESVGFETQVGNWPWWVGGGLMPSYPSLSSFSPDFRRHTRVTGETVKSLHVLFVDGHVELVTPRAANYALVFR